MASEAKRGKDSEPQCDSSVLKCTCIIGDQPSTSKSATADRVINNQSSILGDQIFYVPCSKRTYKTISEISQNDFIVHNSQLITTLTKEVIQMKFAKLFVDANVNRKKAE